MVSFIASLWQILLELSPSLLLGLLIAGLMHAYLPDGFVHRGLSGNDWGSVARASLIGVPLPLCSCGVIPTALGLRKEGASPGATTSFLISTPQTGVDAILVSAAFLGWPFAIFKLIAAFVTGIVGGLLTNRFAPASAGAGESGTAKASESGDKKRGLLGALRYAVFDLLGAIDRWLIFGILVAALVTTLTPEDFFASQSWSSGLLGMLVMLAISLPLYVCTTASVPIAASLIAAGLPAGSALVFLMAGPATNIATIGAVYRTLGIRVIAIYLGTVILASLGFGLLFNQILNVELGAAHAHGQHASWLSYLSTALLLALLALLEYRRREQRQHARQAANQAAQGDDDALVLEVAGMTCGHCVASVKKALEAVDQVEEATPELSSGRVWLRAPGVEVASLRQAVEQAGFQLKTCSSG
ncbi:permease [Thiorhodovibrio frisius]|uniref:Putative permease n=1 Tax=Thiorhodovibrio frisius TaxID=631362 RepID=H8YVM1_9GAMM|nr:permease [Thiorhodovibrio frisius]EIC23961.1 putative permease [Thiorhodovibrio frisius]WPL23034.1 Copper chaperone CopZ [Thiorhodovibrio frisius]